DFGLMHGENHCGRGAGAAERVAHLGNVVDRSAEAAELDRDLRAEQLALARRVDRGLGEAALEVDLFGFRRCSRRHCCGPFHKGKAMVEQYRLTGFATAANARVLDVHGSTPPRLIAANICAGWLR